MKGMKMITQFQGGSSQAFCARQPKGLSRRELFRVVADINLASAVSDKEKQQKFANGIVDRIRRGKLDHDVVVSQLKDTEQIAKLDKGFFPYFAPVLRKCVEASKDLPPIPPVTFRGFIHSLKGSKEKVIQVFGEKKNDLVEFSSSVFSKIKTLITKIK